MGELEAMKRILSAKDDPLQHVERIPPDMLDYLATERDAIIMKLRKIDQLLIKNGRLHRETIPRRIR